MYSVLTETISELEIDRSRFIGIIRHIDDKDDLEEIINEIKKRYPKARHYCYALVIDNYEKASDDGEPSGTAGRPILGLIKKTELNHVVVVVVRYFGGILLGAGRLLRAYVETSQLAISKAEKQKIVQGYEICLKTNYENYQNLLNYLKKLKVQIIDTKFAEEINVIGFTIDDIENQITTNFYQNVQVVTKNSTHKYMKEED